MPLHKLPNGSWIDLAQVVAIRLLPATYCSITKTEFDERVAVHWGERWIEICTPADPIAFANELAALVNQPRTEAHRQPAATGETKP